MSFHRKTFFDAMRESVFNGALKQTTVDGINAILDEWERRKLTDLRWLAYMLATCHGEVGTDMQPVREGFTRTDAAARAYVTRQKYAYAKEINNHVYYGRGLVQLTWEANYRAMGKLLGLDLAANPDLALIPAVAVKIMFEGMIRGTFTGKSLALYFNDHGEDWVSARRIINGTDKAAAFAAVGKQFYAALKLAEAYKPPPDIEPILPVPTPKPGFLAGLFSWLKRSV